MKVNWAKKILICIRHFVCSVIYWQIPLSEWIFIAIDLVAVALSSRYIFYGRFPLAANKGSQFWLISFFLKNDKNLLVKS